MNTARLNQGTPLLLSAVTKQYAANTVLNQLDCIYRPGSSLPWLAAAVVVKARCCVCWQGWSRPPQAHYLPEPPHWRKFRMIRV